MAYTINRTDGTIVTTITDGTVDNTTSLQLFGKSFSGFGEGLNENLVKLLENAASTSAPTAPLKGELWFDTTTNQLKVYDGTSFKPTGGAKTSATQPTSPSAGDLWHDSSNDQLFLYTGSAFLLVGPVFTSGQTLSGFQIETLASSGGNKVVSSMYVGNTRVAILSKETFTPSASQSGFAEIKAGIIPDPFAPVDPATGQPVATTGPIDQPPNMPSSPKSPEASGDEIETPSGGEI